jgi:hypothetical protein
MTHADRAFWLCVTTVIAACAASSTDLVERVSARVFVVGVDSNEIAQLQINNQSVALPGDIDSNLISFSLDLPPGTHDGDITIFRVRDDDSLRPDRCGGFELVVNEGGEPAALALVVDDLEDCDEDNDDDEAGEGEDDDGGMGEGEDDGNGMIDGEGEGEGEDDGSGGGDGGGSDGPPDGA